MFSQTTRLFSQSIFGWWSLAILVSLIMITLNGHVDPQWIEAVGFLTASICVWEAARDKERNWAIGAISCVAFFIIFANARLWGNMALQIIYIIQAFWGDFSWRFGGMNRTKLAINGLPSLGLWAYLFLFTVVTITVTAILTYLNGSAPFWDTVTTVLSIVANQLLIRKRIENWYIWIVVDAISIFLFAYYGLWITTLTYVLYLFICVAKALPNWRKNSTND